MTTKQVTAVHMAAVAAAALRLDKRLAAVIEAGDIDVKTCKRVFSGIKADNLASVLNKARPPQGKTLLHTVAGLGKTEVVDWLIKQSVDVNIKDKTFRTALFDAVESKNNGLETITLLLAAGSDPSSIDKDGMTAIEVALQLDDIKLEVVRLLAEKDSQALLRMIACCESDSDLPDYQVKQVFKLIEVGVDVNIPRSGGERDGETPLILAARIGCLPIIKRLVESGANDELVTIDGEEETAIHCAARTGWDDCVKYLLKKGGSKPALNKKCGGYTLLHLAARDGNRDLVEFLIEEGADPMPLTKNGDAAIHLACMECHDIVAVILLECMMEKSTLPTAINPSLVRSLLWAAVSYWCNRTVERLLPIISRGGVLKKLLSEERLDLQRTIGYEAVQRGSLKITRLLLGYGASFEGTDKKGNTAIHHLAIHGEDDILLELLEKYPHMRSRCNDRNNDTETPMELAIMRNYREFVKALLQTENPKWSVPTDSDIEKWTILHWVTYYGKLDLAIWIIAQYTREILPVIDPKGKLYEIALKYHPGDIELQECVRLPEIKKSEPELATILELRHPILDNYKAKPICEEALAYLYDVYSDKAIQFPGRSLYDVIYGFGPEKVMSAFTSAQGIKKESPLQFRWIHLPANNINWLKDLVQRIYYDKASNSGSDILESVYKQRHDQIQRLIERHLSKRSGPNPADPVFQVHADSGHGRKTLNSASLLPGEAGTGNSVIISMPYLSLCTVENYKELQKMRSGIWIQEQGPQEEYLHQILNHKRMTNFYVNSKGQPLYTSISLGKFQYGSLPSSHSRNTGQVLFRYQQSRNARVCEGQLLCVVDQFWVCVTDDAFPQSWHKDSMNLYEIICQHFIKGKNEKPQASTAWEMMSLFINVAICETTARRCRIVKQSESVLDAFTSSIWNVNDREIELMYRLTEHTILSDEILLNISAASMITIGQEIRLLREVRDIKEELSIIQELLQKQKQLLKMVSGFLGSGISGDPNASPGAMSIGLINQ
ncbi:Ankyrin repeat and death domain-containing protein 1A [Orbilia blumenaviensis]|uniref:protein S-acyltransferase n=1 Tax=Orbilia blumenaviensis TaxID=1796055 RepID=A0AAV9TZV5_9PEZI